MDKITFSIHVRIKKCQVHFCLYMYAIKYQTHFSKHGLFLRHTKFKTNYAEAYYVQYHYTQTYRRYKNPIYVAHTLILNTVCPDICLQLI